MTAFLAVTLADDAPPARAVNALRRCPLSVLSVEASAALVVALLEADTPAAFAQAEAAVLSVPGTLAETLVTLTPLA